MEHQNHSVARVWVRGLASLALALMLWAWGATPAHAVAGHTQVGTGTAASCTFQSLKSALANAFDPLLVTFDCGASPAVINVTATITFPNISGATSDITIDGGTPGLITLNAVSVRTIDQTYLNNLTLKNLTFTGGSAPGCSASPCGGGAIFNPGRSLTIVNSTFSGNRVTGSVVMAANGGAIYSGGPLWVSGSTFTNNQALIGNGGAIYASTATITGTRFSGNSSTFNAATAPDPTGRGGALYAAGASYDGISMQISGSSFTSNTAGDSGGAIYKAASVWVHTLSVANTTFSGNSAQTGGGALMFGFTGSNGITRITNSTIAGNSTVSGTGAGISGPIKLLSNSIVANNSPGGNCSVASPDGGGNVVYGDTSCPGINANPVLGALTGTLPYFRLGAGSAAVNRGIAAKCVAADASPNYGAGSVDQLGVARRVFYCDSGAVEAQPASLAVAAGSNQSTAINTPFATVLQARVLDAFGNKLSGSPVTFTGPGSGAGIANGGVNLSGPGGIAFLEATANGTVGAYNVTASATGASSTNFSLTNRNPYAVTYSGNGNTGGSAPVDGSYYPTAGTVTVLGNTGALTRIGSTFAGWNTVANGSGTPYAGGATFAISVNVTLYAQWTPVTRAVTYNANGSTGGNAPVDGNAYAPGATVAVLANTGGLLKTGFTFAGWNSAADGTGVNYPASGASSFAMGGSNVTLYAQWSNPCTLDVDGNNQVDALTDGLILLRAMFGLTGTAVTSGAIGSGTPTRSTWGMIQPYLNATCGSSFSP